MEQDKKQYVSKVFHDNIGLIQRIAIDTAPAYDLVGDIVNDVFINFVENAHRWDIQRDLRPVLVGITRNLAKRYWREFVKNSPERMRKIYEFLKMKRNEEYEDTTALDTQLQALHTCKQKLDPKFRMLLDTHYAGGITLVELARQLDLNPGALRVTMCRLRETLRTCMEKVLRIGVDYDK